MKEETLFLQSSINQLEKELEDRNEMIGQMKENTAQTDRKYEEVQMKVQLLNAALMKKEKQEETFKMETNSQVDEALQYVKLIEKEFHLESSECHRAVVFSVIGKAVGSWVSISWLKEGVYAMIYL